MKLIAMIHGFWAADDYTAAMFAACGLLVTPVWVASIIWSFRKGYPADSSDSLPRSDTNR